MFKALAAIMVFNWRLGTRFATWYFEKFTTSVEDSIVALSRGFKPSDDFLGKFRIKPSPCLLHFMSWRLESFDTNKRDVVDSKLVATVDTLAKAGIFMPGIG